MGSVPNFVFGPSCLHILATKLERWLSRIDGKAKSKREKLLNLVRTFQVTDHVASGDILMTKLSIS